MRWVMRWVMRLAVKLGRQECPVIGARLVALEHRLCAARQELSADRQDLLFGLDGRVLASRYLNPLLSRHDLDPLHLSSLRHISVISDTYSSRTVQTVNREYSGYLDLFGLLFACFAKVLHQGFDLGLELGVHAPQVECFENGNHLLA